MTPPASLPPSPRESDPARWLGSTSLIDVSEPRLRIRAASLTQLSRDEREKAMRLHDFVKRLPIHMHLQPSQVSAREVLGASRANAVEKTTLLIALLRAAGIPARLRYLEIGADLLHGLVPYMAKAYRPIVDVWLDSQWLKIDTHLFDATYVAAARQRLRDEERDFGYGIARDGHTMWNGRHDAYVGTVADASRVLLSDLGVFEDELEFLASATYRTRHSRMAREARWRLKAPFMNRVIARLRAEGEAESLPGKRASA